MTTSDTNTLQGGLTHSWEKKEKYQTLTFKWVNTPPATDGKCTVKVDGQPTAYKIPQQTPLTITKDGKPAAGSLRNNATDTIEYTLTR